MHLKDDLLITPTLLKRFILEAEVEGGNGKHYALIRRENTSLLCHHPGSPNLDPMQLMWAADVLQLLNRELHHDGAWVIVFTHPIPPRLESVLQDAPKHWEYARYALIWIDEDGDPQFTQEWEKGDSSELVDFAAIVKAGIHSTAQKAETSWQLWHHHMREVLAPKKDQLVKAAQGQTRH